MLCLDQEPATVSRQAFLTQQVQHPKHPIHRCAELMAHVGQELGFGFRGGLRLAFGIDQRQLLALARVDIEHDADKPLDHAVCVVADGGARLDPAIFTGWKEDAPLRRLVRTAGLRTGYGVPHLGGVFRMDDRPDSRGFLEAQRTPDDLHKLG